MQRLPFLFAGAFLWQYGCRRFGAQVILVRTAKVTVLPAASAVRGSFACVYKANNV